MEKKLPREEAWELLTEYTKTSALRKHALAVEAVMCHFARLNGEDEEVWGGAGLLHDLDYEKFPEEHCRKAEEIMRAREIDETYIRAMNCHAYGICTETRPENATNLIILGFLIYFTHDSARIPNCHTIGWNITSDNAARPNHTACSNFNPRENDDAPSNPASISNFNRKRINPAKMGSALRRPIRCQTFL